MWCDFAVFLNRYRATKVTIKGEPTGPLTGKTLAIKDNIFVAGVPLQNGSKIWDGYTPEFDATVVTRILKAGGTITGKSTCENMCFSGGSFTSASGAVLNPHDKTRQTGGSSSGSAALVRTAFHFRCCSRQSLQLLWLIQQLSSHQLNQH